MTIGWNENQGSPHVTVNQMAFGSCSIDVSGLIDYILSDYEASFAVIKVIGTVDSPFTLVIPEVANLIVVRNYTEAEAEVFVTTTNSGGYVPIVNSTSITVGTEDNDGSDYYGLFKVG